MSIKGTTWIALIASVVTACAAETSTTTSALKRANRGECSPDPIVITHEKPETPVRGRDLLSLTKVSDGDILPTAFRLSNDGPAANNFTLKKLTTFGPADVVEDFGFLPPTEITLATRLWDCSYVFASSNLPFLSSDGSVPSGTGGAYYFVGEDGEIRASTLVDPSVGGRAIAAGPATVLGGDTRNPTLVLSKQIIDDVVLYFLSASSLADSIPNLLSLIPANNRLNLTVLLRDSLDRLDRENADFWLSSLYPAPDDDALIAIVRVAAGSRSSRNLLVRISRAGGRWKDATVRIEKLNGRGPLSGEGPRFAKLTDPGADLSLNSGQQTLFVGSGDLESPLTEASVEALSVDEMPEVILSETAPLLGPHGLLETISHSVSLQDGTSRLFGMDRKAENDLSSPSALRVSRSSDPSSEVTVHRGLVPGARTDDYGMLATGESLFVWTDNRLQVFDVNDLDDDDNEPNALLELSGGQWPDGHTIDAMWTPPSGTDVATSNAPVIAQGSGEKTFLKVSNGKISFIAILNGEGGIRWIDSQGREVSEDTISNTGGDGMIGFAKCQLLGEDC